MIEYDADAGNSEEARTLAEKALDQGLSLRFDGPKATALWADVEARRAAEAKRKEDEKAAEALAAETRRAAEAKQKEDERLAADEVTKGQTEAESPDYSYQHGYEMGKKAAAADLCNTIR